MTMPRPLTLLVCVATLSPSLLAAAGLDKEAKKWLESVAPLILLDELKVYEGLKDKADQAEFQKLFWARRDPDITTPENEYQAEYEKARALADERFKVAGPRGSATDCGRALILLGEPTEVKKGDPDDATVSHDHPDGGGRSPETWHYKSDRFSGGEGVISFDAGCMGPRTDAFRKQMDRVAAGKVVNPNIDYRVGKDGHLTRLADLLPKPSAAQALLKTPREDFALGTQVAFLKGQGGSVLVGLVHGDATGLAEAGATKLQVVLCAQAADAQGKVAAFAEQAVDAVLGADGVFVGTFRIVVKPGTYTLKAGALEPKSGKGSVSQTSVEVPDFAKGELTATSWLLQGVEDKNEASDPVDPYAASTLGTARLIPHLGQIFTKAQSVWFFYQYYDPKVDEQTHKAAVLASAAVFRRTALLAKTEDQTFETPVGGTTVGPISLASYIPGSYRMQVKLVDKVGGKEVIQDIPFEVAK